ncbi:MAG: hypothetical protein LBB55_04075, partial [Zoogloeaceae bacterium]|nr:hypothetical protein [Zoogloeaceae bacterium]
MGGNGKRQCFVWKGFSSTLDCTRIAPQRPPCVKKSIFYKKHGGASFILRGQYRKKWSTTMNRTYEAFINGHLRLPDRETSF